MSRIGVMCVLAIVAVFAPRAMGDDELAAKRRAARAAAEALIRPSGPLQQTTPLTNTPPEWRPRGAIAGGFTDHAARLRYGVPVAPWFWGYGWGPYGCGRGFGVRGGVGIWGYSTW